MMCSNLHCQKGFNLILFGHKFRVDRITLPTAGNPIRSPAPQADNPRKPFTLHPKLQTLNPKH